MTVAADASVRWLRAGPDPHLDTSARVYRAEPWVAALLERIGERLAGITLDPLRFDTARDALVAIGRTDTGALRIARVSYRDVLLFHPGLNPRVEAVLAEVLDDVLVELGRSFVQGDELRARGRRALLDDPGLLLADDVVAGVRGLGLHGLPPVGVSGVVEVQAPDGEYVVGALRSDLVAVNAGCLAPPIDGGLCWDGTALDPLADLDRERLSELPWDIAPDAWEALGVYLSAPGGAAVDGRPTLPSGANLVFRATVKADPEDLVRRTAANFESTRLVLIDASRRDRTARVPDLLVDRDGTLVPLDDPPPLAEVLAAVLDELAIIRVTDSSPAHGRSEAAMSAPATPIPAQELSLEDAWAEQLTFQFPRLYDVLDTIHVRDLAEARRRPNEDGVQPLLDAVREFELVCRSNQLELFDEARLFEAIFYRVSRNLFAHDEHLALAYDDYLAEYDRLGAVYQRRLDDAIGLLDGSGPPALAPAERVETHSTAVDVRERMPAVLGPRVDVAAEVTKRLRELNTDEAAMAYSEVRRRAQLLCFCAGLCAVESKRSIVAAEVALKGEYRKALANDAIALFFRARALLVSPVASTAQTQLGLQFVTTALSYYPRNAGMHHTRAHFLLRKSSAIVGEQESFECLEQALGSVEEALRWDAEFAVFYATRAKIKYRQHNRSGALLDLRAAIELARYGTDSRAARKDIGAWEALLETWDLAPVGAASGTG